jgi:hypothetical protein
LEKATKEGESPVTENSLKAAGKYINAHGMVGDLSICKGYIYNKYQDETGNYVEMAAWSETIEGLITEECRIVVKLPGKA